MPIWSICVIIAAVLIIGFIFFAAYSNSRKTYVCNKCGSKELKTPKTERKTK